MRAGLLLASGALIALWSAADAATPTGGTVVSRRVRAMQDLQKAHDLLVAMVEKKAPFERAPAFRAARTIRQLAGPGMTELFPPGSEGGGSKALPAVWTDWPGFEAYAGRLYLNGSFLVRAAQAADTGTDLREALASVTEVCRACHARYLAKK
jgi:cytochrome c556